MQNSWFQQIWRFTVISWKLDFCEKERFVSPLMFSLSILLLFNFALTGIAPSEQMHVYTAEIFVALFVTLQLSLRRVFASENNDEVFSVIRSLPVSYTAWFLGKLIHNVFFNLIIFVPILFFSGLLNMDSTIPLWNWDVFLVGFLVIIGLSSLGILLAAVTLSTKNKEVLFPIIYFPLCIPIMLAAVQYSLGMLGGLVMGTPEQASQWLKLIGAFDLIFISLGSLLFHEFLDDRA